MGVSGLHTLIKDRGFLDPSNVATIPSGSTLAVDGSGLAFHIHDLAYHDYYHDVMKQYKDKRDRCDANSNEDLMALVSSLLPSMMPLSYCRDKCRSILEDWLYRARVHVYIYLDHPKNRRMKMQVSLKRQMQRDEEEQNLKRFCLYGLLPQSFHGLSKSFIPPPETFLQTFPYSRLWSIQMINDLLAFENEHKITRYKMCKVMMKVAECESEADVEVASHSANDVMGRTYAVGNDTDYIIFGKNDIQFVKYVRFDTLNLKAIQMKPGSKRSDNTDSSCFMYNLEGIILTRAMLSNGLNLPDESLIVELAILLGNDYTKRFLNDSSYLQTVEFFSDLDFEEHRQDRVLSIARVLAMKPSNYRVTSADEDFEKAIQFSRDLYMFQDLSDYMFDVYDVEGDQLSDIEGFDSNLATFQTVDLRQNNEDDTTLRNRILWPFKCYLKASKIDRLHMQDQRFNRNEDDVALTQYHLKALEMCLLPRAAESLLCDLDKYGKLNDCHNPVAVKSFQSNMFEITKYNLLLTHRIHWNDVLVTIMVDSCVDVAVKSLSEIRPIPVAPKKFDLLQNHLFHRMMCNKRESDKLLTVRLPSENSSTEGKITTSCSSTFRSTQSKSKLPIDDYEDVILQTIQEHRVTIIQGGTGCGKSSRLPVMILRSPPPDPSVSHVKLFISQPRRIAAKTLVDRIRSSEPDLRGSIALRMGHGVREYESGLTQLWFCTTGYLVRLLANYPESFRDHTHLIIDEVHERSVDTDLLCMLAKRLLLMYPHIRLVIMSATLSVEMYKEYFNVQHNPINVGSRLYPVKEYFIEDIPSIIKLGETEKKITRQINEKYTKKNAKCCPSSHDLGLLHHLAIKISIAVGSPGSSVLIFVAGIFDIISITEKIEMLVVPGLEYKCIPIHSDIPFEEQLFAFKPPEPGEVKIILATNAAESSITLPDVDHVICMGLCKQMIYDKDSHRQMLAPCWISQASATQRAGRTGRVREGTVYRLYSRELFEHIMQPYEVGEMLRTPLDSVILSIKDIMRDKPVLDVLRECIEPPHDENVKKSIESLHSHQFISHPTDDSNITKLGLFVIKLGIDLTWGALVGLGIQFGLVSEAIYAAAILSLQKSPWRIGNAYFHEPDDFNDIITKTYASKVHFDAGLHSDIMCTMNMLHDYSKSKDRDRFIHKHSLSAPRVRQLVLLVNALKDRVTEALDLDVKARESLKVEKPPREMLPAKLVIFRVLLGWTMAESIIISNPSTSLHDYDGGSYIMSASSSDLFQEKMLHSILDPKVYNYSVTTRNDQVYSGDFRADSFDFNLFEERLISYGLEHDFRLMFYKFEDTIFAFSTHASYFCSLKHVFGDDFELLHERILCNKKNETKNRRGVRGRACGAWSVQRDAGINDRVASDATAVLVSFLYRGQRKLIDSKLKAIIKSLQLGEYRVKTLSIAFTTHNKKSDDRGFTLRITNHPDLILSSVDVSNLFSASDVKVSSLEPSTGRIKILFPSDRMSSVEEATVLLSDNSAFSWNKFSCGTPLGVRILSAIACGRKDHSIRFPLTSDNAQPNISSTVALVLAKKETRFTDRWFTLLSNKRAYVDCCSVPAIGNKQGKSYACCGHYLLLQGGDVRAENLTLLSQDPLFLVLVLISLGHNIPELLKSDLRVYCPCLASLLFLPHADFSNTTVPANISQRITLAESFQKSYQSLGNDLSCDENRLRDLCLIFEVKPWSLSDCATQQVKSSGSVTMLQEKDCLVGAQFVNPRNIEVNLSLTNTVYGSVSRLQFSSVHETITCVSNEATTQNVDDDVGDRKFHTSSKYTSFVNRTTSPFIIDCDIVVDASNPATGTKDLLLRLSEYMDKNGLLNLCWSKWLAIEKETTCEINESTFLNYGKDYGLEWIQPTSLFPCGCVRKCSKNTTDASTTGIPPMDARVPLQSLSNYMTEHDLEEFCMYKDYPKWQETSSFKIKKRDVDCFGAAFGLQWVAVSDQYPLGSISRWSNETSEANTAVAHSVEALSPWKTLSKETTEVSTAIAPPIDARNSLQSLSDYMTAHGLKKFCMYKDYHKWREASSFKIKKRDVDRFGAEFGLQWVTETDQHPLVSICRRSKNTTEASTTVAPPIEARISLHSLSDYMAEYGLEEICMNKDYHAWRKASSLKIKKRDVDRFGAEFDLHWVAPSDRCPSGSICRRFKKTTEASTSMVSPIEAPSPLQSLSDYITEHGIEEFCMLKDYPNWNSVSSCKVTKHDIVRSGAQFGLQWCEPSLQFPCGYVLKCEARTVTSPLTKSWNPLQLVSEYMFVHDIEDFCMSAHYPALEKVTRKQVRKRITMRYGSRFGLRWVDASASHPKGCIRRCLWKDVSSHDWDESNTLRDHMTSLSIQEKTTYDNQDKTIAEPVQNQIAHENSDNVASIHSRDRATCEN